MTSHHAPHDNENTDPDGQSGAEPEARRDRVRGSLEERLARPAPTIWLSGQEAAEYVGVSWPTLRQTLVEHDIPCLHTGTRWRIDVATLDEHLHRLAKGG